MNKQQQRRYVMGAVLLVLVVLFYFPIIQAGYIWDDDSYLTDNLTLRSLAGLYKIWFSPTSSPQYYPLVFSSFWLEYQLWGLSPLGYHIVNVSLHAATALSVWLLLDLLALPGAWFAALVFALHPINLESVAWVSERKNVLAGLLCVQSAIAFLRYRDIGNDKSKDDHAQRRKLYLIAIGLFALALLAKSIVAMLPPVLILLIWWKRGEISRSDILKIAPFFVLGAVAGLNTAWLEVTHVGASGGEWFLTAGDRLIVAGRTACFYAGKLLWPANLSFNYPRWHIGGGWQYLFPVGVALSVALLWWTRGRLGRGPCAAVLCYLVLLFPASGFLNLFPMRYSFVADHFQYLAGICLIALFVCGAIALRQRLWQGPLPAWILWSTRTAGILITLGLGLTTMNRIPEFNNEETLWTATLVKNPESWLAAGNLGTLRCRENRLPEALELFRRAEKLQPNNPVALNGIGLVTMAYGENQQAVQYFKRAAELEPTPQYYNNLGLAYSNLGLKQQAIAAFEHATHANNRIVAPFYNLGFELHELGQYAEAEKYYLLALEIDSEAADVHYNYGQLLGLMGRYDEAITHFRAALKSRPNFPEASESLEAARALQSPH